MGMTEIEARSKIKYRIATAMSLVGTGEDGKAYEDLEIALQALKEIREYRELGTVEDIQLIFSLCKDLERIVKKYEAIGTVEEFKALKEKNEPTEPEFMHNRSDIVSVWKCQCGNIFQTKHKEGILDGTDVNYCCKCGQKFDWGMKGGVTDERTGSN